MFTLPIKVRQIACGGMHTLVLTTHGRVYSWGCNDEGALGREGAENTPIMVDKSLNYPMTNVTAGDSHSVAYNTSLNLIYRWGLYRNAISGKIEDAQRTPIRIGEEVLKGRQLKKVASGAHHTLVLASGIAFGWGDPETGKIGRMLKSRNKNSQGLIIEAIALKNVKDIFCSTDSSFAINETKNGVSHVYSWGLNNWGQLGIGHRENVSMPTEIKELRGIPIKMICGGAQHSLALTEEGHVYSWGKNEEGQLGVGDTYSDFARQRQEEIMQIDAEERKLNEECNKLIQEAKEKGDKTEVRKLTTSHKKSLKKLSARKEENDDAEDILYFPTPMRVPNLSHIFYIDSGATFNYAIGKRVKEEEKKDSQDDKMAVEEPKPESQPEQKEEVKEDVKEENKESEMKVDTNQPESSQDQKATPDVNMSENKEASEKVPENNGEQAPKPVTETEKPQEGEKVEPVNPKPEEAKPVEVAPAEPVTPVKPVVPAKPASPEIDERLNVVYSWGIGNSYVLGTRDEDTRYTPYEVPQDMYKHLNPLTVSCGTLHVVVKAINADEKEEEFELEAGVHVVPDELAEELKSEAKSTRKRKRKDMESDSKDAEETKKKEVTEKPKAAPKVVPKSPKKDKEPVKKEAHVKKDEHAKREKPVPVNKNPVGKEIKPKETKQNPDEKKTKSPKASHPESKELEKKLGKIKIEDAKEERPAKRMKTKESDSKEVHVKHKTS